MRLRVALLLVDGVESALTCVSASSCVLLRLLYMCMQMEVGGSLPAWVQLQKTYAKLRRDDEGGGYSRF